MRIRIRQRRELAIALPRWSTIGVASGVAVGVLAITVWRLRQPRVGDEAERWLRRRR
jgi:hypothetical protein